ncbi:MAG TPA: hypothetical protein VIJ40_01795 [Acidimicrobiales bacterium]
MNRERFPSTHKSWLTLVYARRVTAALAIAVVAVTGIGGEATTVGASIAKSDQGTIDLSSSGLQPATVVTEGLCQVAYDVNRLSISRSKPLNPETFTFPALFKVNKALNVQSIARALCALPLGPTGVINCPADWGVNYTFQFSVTDGSSVQLVSPVTVDAAGCETVQGLDGGRSVSTAPSFWRIVGNSMGLKSATGTTFSGKMKGL